MNNLYLVWNSQDESKYVVGKLFHDEKYYFNYVDPDLSEAKGLGVMTYPGFAKHDYTYESETLFPNIKTRLPNKERPDYSVILSSFDATDTDNDFTILEKTKGKLLTDRFEFLSENNEFIIEFIEKYMQYKK